MTRNVIYVGLCLGLALSLQAVENRNHENLIPGDSSFEIGRGVLISRSHEKLTSWRNDRTTAAVGRSSLLVDVALDTRTAGEQAWIEGTAFYFKEKGRYTFSFYAKTDAGTNKISSLFYGPGHKWEAWQDFHYLTSAWRRYSYSMEIGSGNYHFIFCFRQSPCRVWLDGFQLESGDIATPYHPRDKWTVALNVTSDTWKVFYPTETIPVEMGAYASETNLDMRGLDFSYEIIDFFGRPVQSGDKQIGRGYMQKLRGIFRPSEPESKGYYRQDLLFNPGKAGYYVIKARLKKKGKVLGEGLAAVAVVEPPVAIATNMQPFCGIACGADKYEGLWRMGVKWLEVQPSWSGEEPHKGGWAESEPWKKMMDQRIRDFYQRGFRIKMGFHPLSAPKWALDPAELKEQQETGLGGALLPARASVAAYAAYVRRCVLRWRDLVDLYEVGGEDNLRFSLLNDYYKKKYPDAVVKINAEQVPIEHRGGILNTVPGASFVLGPVVERTAELYCAAIDQIHELDKGKPVGILRPSSYGHNLSYLYDLEVMKRMPDKFDLFSMDPYFMCEGLPGLPEGTPGSYKGGGAPEDALAAELKRGNELTRQYAKGQPIYISEVGMTRSFFAEPDSEIARIAAKYIARSHLVARLTPNVKSCHWYIETHEGITATELTPQVFGLWLRGNPYPQVAAYSAVAQVVENVEETRKLELGAGIYCVVFRKANGADAALWMHKGECEWSVKGVDGVTARDVVGSPVVLEKKNDRFILKLTGYPLYLHCAGADGFEKLIKILSAE